MEPWEIELQKEVNDRPQIIVINKKSKNHSFLYFVITLLIMILCFSFVYKKYSNVRNWISSHFKTEKIEQLSDQSKNTIWEKLNKIEEELKKNSQKINLIGISQNENFSLLSNDVKNKFVFIEENWKLSKYPENLILNENIKDFLKDHVKDQ